MISEHFATTADALGDRYRLDRLLQSGCAAYVYLAEDLRSGRRVAVKVLREEMAATANASRFLSEIEVARQLRHPHIVPVYDSGDIGGIPYYVMPFIAGETLRTRLMRVGRIRLGEALRIAEHIARALQFAHRHRVVHRDIKPENVMLDGDRAVVLDFGIALMLDTLDMPRRTIPGLTLGTFHYMSPEQVDGAVEIDGRSDIYSFGCLVYEMLSGRPPFTGTPNAVIRRHLAERPRSVTSVCPGVPPKIDAAVLRSLQKSPGDRFATAAEFMAALTSGAHRVRVVGRRVAVLPFVHASASPAIDTFSDGIGEEIAALLRDFDGLVVVPNVIGDRGGKRQHVTDVARRAGADVLLLGDARQSADDRSVLITAALYDGRTGRRIWSGASATRLSDDARTPNGAVREIAGAVANALRITRLVDRAERCGSERFTASHASLLGMSTAERSVRH